MMRKNVWLEFVLFLTAAAFLQAQYVVLHEFTPSGGGGGGGYNSFTKKGSALYGMTQHGGATFGEGTIFRINFDGSEFELLHTFIHSADEGVLPYGDLVCRAPKKPETCCTV